MLLFVVNFIEDSVNTSYEEN